MPTIHKNGSHTFNLCKLFDASESEIPLVSGAITWSAHNGVEVVLVTAQPLYEPERTSAEEQDSVGKLYQPEINLSWVAQDTEGLKLQLYGFERRQTQWYGSNFTLKGTAAYVEVDLPIDNTFAYDQIEPDLLRHFVQGFYCGECWPEKIAPDWEHRRGTTSHPCDRLILSTDPKVVVRDAQPTYAIKGAVFVCYATQDYNSVFEDDTFFAFLQEGPVFCFWSEWHTNERTIRRKYRGRTKNSGVRSTKSILPFHIDPEQAEELSPGQIAVEKLPRMYAAFKSLNNRFLISRILSPLWFAQTSYLDDRVSYASICLERFKKLTHGLRASKSQSKILSEVQFRGLLEVLKKAMNDCSADLSLTSDQIEFIEQRKLTQLNHAPNSNALKDALELFGLTLTESEQKALNYRNRALHGSMTTSEKIDDLQVEADQFDILRNLLNKAVLSMLDYDGPYMDFSTRGADEYEIKTLELRPKPTATTPSSPPATTP